MMRSRRLALTVVPLALAVAGLLSGTAAQASSCDTVAITVQPTTTQLGSVLKPAVTVQVERPGGAVDQGYHGPVTLGYAVNRIGAPAPSGTVVNAVQRGRLRVRAEGRDPRRD
jgi:hypothetical protein